jgi:hypothetical protein
MCSVGRSCVRRNCPSEQIPMQQRAAPAAVEWLVGGRSAKTTGYFLASDPMRKSISQICRSADTQTHHSTLFEVKSILGSADKFMCQEPDNAILASNNILPSLSLTMLRFGASFAVISHLANGITVFSNSVPRYMFEVHGIHSWVAQRKSSISLAELLSSLLHFLHLPSRRPNS